MSSHGTVILCAMCYMYVYVLYIRQRDCKFQGGTKGKGMVSSGKVSCIVFVMHVEYLLLRVMCVLMYVHVLVGVNDNVYSCMDTCTCMSKVVGAWPMAGTLWRLFEYYYYYT